MPIDPRVVSLGRGIGGDAPDWLPGGSEGWANRTTVQSSGWIRRVLTVAIAVLVVGAGVGPAAAAGVVDDRTDGVDGETAGTAAPGGPFAAAIPDGGDPTPAAVDGNGSDEHEAPPDPEEDVLGWEEVNGSGLWYNESIDVDNSDGLNRSERDKVVARSMARIEVVRELEFESTVPVEVISREEFANRSSGRYRNISDEERLFHNVLAEARFFSGERDDWIDNIQALNTGTVLGFYSPTEDRIVVISENTTSPRLDEITLAQELYHALQGQKFDLYEDYLGGFENGTMNIEDHNRFDSVIEGDGNYVDYLYEQRCGEEWDCLLPEEGAGPPSLGPGEFGAVVTQLAPYSEGVAFVVDVRDEGGWEAVNQLYENPPASTEQAIHPDRYGEDEPTEVTVEDRSSDRWQRLVPPANGSIGGIPGQNASYGEFGEAGIFSMFVVPSYENRQETIVKWAGLFTNRDLDPYDYRSPVTDGWDGDRLIPYVRDDSFETNETAYVWKSEWDSEEDAEQFASAYVELLEYYDAESVDGRADTYRIADPQLFSDAFYVQREGTTVWIVNAPTVEELSEVREGAAPEVETTTTTTTESGTTTTEEGDSTTTTTGDDSTTTTGTADGDGDDGSGGQETPGFGIGAAVVALLAVLVLGARRYRR